MRTRSLSNRILLALCALAVAACASKPAPIGGLRIAEHAYTWDAAAGADCPAIFLERQAPIVFSRKSLGDAAELCFAYFAVLHSSAMRAPLWAAEKLTPSMARAGDTICREDRFHVEGRLAPDARAGSSDYAGHRDVWDRGHMVPADDMPDMNSQEESFSLANMVPQASYLNQHAWADLEARLNGWAEQNGQLYLVTGPIFAERVERLNGRVAIPSHVFKAIYAPSTREAVVYIARNRNDAEIGFTSLAMLEERYGVMAFPSLPRRTRNAVRDWDLPDSTRSNTPCPR